MQEAQINLMLHAENRKEETKKDGPSILTAPLAISSHFFPENIRAEFLIRKGSWFICLGRIFMLKISAPQKDRHRAYTVSVLCL